MTRFFLILFLCVVGFAHSNDMDLRDEIHKHNEMCMRNNLSVPYEMSLHNEMPEMCIRDEMPMDNEMCVSDEMFMQDEEICIPNDVRFPPFLRKAPRPFEKIYVKPHHIVCDCEGIFYNPPCGGCVKVRALLYDCCGMYVIIF